MIVAGIDIGARGGVALYDGATWRTWQASRSAPLWRIVRDVAASNDVAAWYVERPIILSHDGRKGQQTTGRGVGQLDVVLDGLRRVDVHPSTWQAALGLLSGGRRNRAQHKATLRATASRMVGRDLDEGEADAALIARFGFAALSSASRGRLNA